MKTQRLRISAYALIHDNCHVLLCRLSKELPEWEGCWTLPGGGLEFGESPEEAVIREVEEETGLKIRVTNVAGIDSLVVHRDHEDFQGIRIIYHAEVTGGELRHELSGSTDRCEWHQLQPFPEIKMVELTRIGLDLIHSLHKQNGGSAIIHTGQI